MIYPEYVRINGEKVKINTDTNTALKCLKIVNDNSIGDYERAIAIILLLYGEVPQNTDLWDEMLDKASKFLSHNEKEKNDDNESDIDLVLDERYIAASFMSDYHIDLSKENLHFWQYCDLISGLTENSIMSRVRWLRTCDPSEFAEKDRKELYRAKEKVALPKKLTAEEQRHEDIFEARFKKGGE